MPCLLRKHATATRSGCSRAEDIDSTSAAGELVFHQAAIEAIRGGDADALAEALVGDIQTGYGKIRAAMNEDVAASG